MNKMTLTNNTKRTAFMIFASVAAGIYGLYMMWEYIQESQNYFSSGENLYLVGGLICFAGVAYGIYATSILMRQSVEIDADMISGIGMAPGFFAKAEAFGYPLSKVESADVAMLTGSLRCLKLVISGEAPVFCAVQDPKEAAIAINSFLHKTHN